jgi:DegV family protein with EDD domain
MNTNSNIAIVTDSTCDIKRETTDRLGITVIPLSVIHQGKTYRDGLDITPSTFYPLLKSSGNEIPTTSQPTQIEFSQTFRRLLDEGKEIISIHISRGLSATVDNARVAARDLSEDRIHIVDSGFTSYALGLQVLEAARLAKENVSAKEIVTRLSRMKENSELIFTLDTLLYLEKGGRIGKVASLLGNLIRIKPVIRLEDGVVIPTSKARSMKRALFSIRDYLIKRYKDTRVRLSVGEGENLENAQLLHKILCDSLNIEGPVDYFEVGPVLGVHTGPGVVGAAIYPLEY